MSASKKTAQRSYTTKQARELRAQAKRADAKALNDFGRRVADLLNQVRENQGQDATNDLGELYEQLDAVLAPFLSTESHSVDTTDEEVVTDESENGATESYSVDAENVDFGDTNSTFTENQNGYFGGTQI